MEEEVPKVNEAEEFKKKGNKAYKAKKFEEALEFYDKAIELEPLEMYYYTNKSAVLMSMK